MTLQFPDLDRRGVDDYEDDRDGDDGGSDGRDACDGSDLQCPEVWRDSET